MCTSLNHVHPLLSHCTKGYPGKWLRRQGATHHSTGALKGPWEWWSKASRAASLTAWRHGVAIIPLVGCNAHLVRMLTPFLRQPRVNPHVLSISWILIFWALHNPVANSCSGHEQMPNHVVDWPGKWDGWAAHLYNIHKPSFNLDSHRKLFGTSKTYWTPSAKWWALRQPMEAERQFQWYRTNISQISEHVIFKNGVVPGIPPCFFFRANFHDKDSKAGSIHHDSSWGTALSD